MTCSLHMKKYRFTKVRLRGFRLFSSLKTLIYLVFPIRKVQMTSVCMMDPRLLRRKMAQESSTWFSQISWRPWRIEKSKVSNAFRAASAETCALWTMMRMSKRSMNTGSRIMRDIPSFSNRSSHWTWTICLLPCRLLMRTSYSSAILKMVCITSLMLIWKFIGKSMMTCRCYSSPLMSRIRCISCQKVAKTPSSHDTIKISNCATTHAKKRRNSVPRKTKLNISE